MRPSQPNPIRRRTTFSSIARCPLEIPRLVAPPVGDHRARIAVPRRARLVPAANRAAVREGAHASQILVISNVANPATARNAESIDPRPTAVQRRGDLERTTRAPEIRSPTGSVRLGAMTATTEILAVPNGAPDRVAPGETDGPPADRRRATATLRVVMTARVRRVRALTSKIRRRRARHARTIGARVHRSARVQRAPTGASTSTPVIGGRACRRAIVHRVERDRSVDPGN